MRLGWSQDALGASLVPPRTDVQVSNYELGKQRICASYLYQISVMMHTEMESFFREENHATD